MATEYLYIYLYAYIKAKKKRVDIRVHAKYTQHQNIYPCTNQLKHIGRKETNKRQKKYFVVVKTIKKWRKSQSERAKRREN